MAAQPVLLCLYCREGTCMPNHAQNAWVCTQCDHTYPCVDGVIDTLYGDPPPRTLAQWLMESDWVVRLYESRLWRRNPLFEWYAGISFQEEVREILRAADLQPDNQVLDLACGSGLYSRVLARQVRRGRVVGVDISWPMLRHAVRRAATERLDNLTFVRADALRLPFPDNAFDVVNCCGALHLFDDVDAVLAEMQRVLRPGGRMTAAVFRQRGDTQLSARSAWLGVTRFVPDELLKMIGRAGFAEREIHHNRGGWMLVSSQKTRHPA